MYKSSIYDNVITISRKFDKHSYATYGTLFSCFDLIFVSSAVGHRSMPHLSDSKSTSHGYCAAF